MPVPQSEAPAYLASHSGPLGPGWTEVDTLDTLDPDEYEPEEEDEEEYITLDLGPEMDSKWLQTEGTYQLIGMDTGLPHLKIGDTILQGESTPLIGTEVILGLIRNQENPLRPSHPPLYTTSKRVSFRPIRLRRLDQAHPDPAFLSKTTSTANDGEDIDMGINTEEGVEEGRSIFLQQDARYGPNKPEKLPGRKRDRDRAARRAEREAAGLPAELEAEEEEGLGMGMEIDEATTSPPATTNEYTSAFNTPSQPIVSSTTTSGMLSSPIRPDQTPSSSTTATPRYPGHSSNITPIGRPRTRPLLEITTLQELAHLDVESLPANIRVMVLPAVIHDLNPSAQPQDAMHLPKRPLEYTRGQIRKLIKGSKPRGQGNNIRNKRWEHLAPGEGSSIPSGMTSSPEKEESGPGVSMYPMTPEARVVSVKHRHSRDGVEVPQFITRGGPSRLGEGGQAGQIPPGEGATGTVGDVLPEMRLDMRDEEASEARNRE